MKPLNPKIHGILDYFVVLAFLAAPSLLGLTGIAAQLSYALAAVHLALTLLTDISLGVFQLLPLPIHGWIELAVAPTLIAAPWLFGFAPEARARLFYVAAGAAVFLVWCATGYRTNSRQN
jgi:hypothetical protein